MILKYVLMSSSIEEQIYARNVAVQIIMLSIDDLFPLTLFIVVKRSKDVITH